MGGWVGGWVDGWMDGWMDGWTDGMEWNGMEWNGCLGVGTHTQRPKCHPGALVTDFTQPIDRAT